MVLVRLLCAAALLAGAHSCSIPVQPYRWSLPANIPPPVVPANNPMSVEKVRLGQWLFYDKRLSGNQLMACADCHLQEYAFAQPSRFPVGSTGELVSKNSLALVNVAYQGSLTWQHEGIRSLERQIQIPMFSEQPIEMGMTGNEKEIIERLTEPQYQWLFRQAFGDQQISMLRINQALASFVRSLISFNSPFDRYAWFGEDEALSDSALNGMQLFFSERFECHHCHSGFNFTLSTTHQSQQLDLKPFHHIGIGASDKLTRTPTLRNIALTAPYMHDGSLATLQQVIDHYQQPGSSSSPFVQGVKMRPQEQRDLIAFLESLTDQQFIDNAQHANPLDNTKH